MATGDFVQAIATAGGAAATSVTASVTAASSSGNAIIVTTAQATAASSPVSVTDTQGNTYTLLASLTGRDPNCAVWMASPATPLTTSDTITATWSSSGSGVSLIAEEFVGTYNVDDASVGNNAAAASTTFDSGSGSVPAGDHLLIGVTGRNSNAVWTPSPTADGTWTIGPTPALATSFGRSYRVGYQFRASGGGTLRFTGGTGASFQTNTLAISIPTSGPAPAAATLSGSGTLTAAPVMAVSRSAALSGSGTLIGQPTPAVSRTGTLSGTGTLSATPVPAVARAAALSGSGTLTAATAPGWTRPAALSGSGTLTADVFGYVTPQLSGAGTLTASTAPSWVKTAALSGSGTLTASLVPSWVKAAALSGSGTLTATIKPGWVRTAALSGAGTLSAVAIARYRYAQWTGTVYLPLTPKVYLHGTWRTDIPVDIYPANA